jgi:hypothetical protein
VSIPTRIYLQWHGDAEPHKLDDATIDPNDVSWCVNRIFAGDVEYVRADIAAEMYRALLLARTNGVGPYTPRTRKAVENAIKTYEGVKG